MFSSILHIWVLAGILGICLAPPFYRAWGNQIVSGEEYRLALILYFFLGFLPILWFNHILTFLFIAGYLIFGLRYFEYTLEFFTLRRQQEMDYLNQ